MCTLYDVWKDYKAIQMLKISETRFLENFLKLILCRRFQPRTIVPMEVRPRMSKTINLQELLWLILILSIEKQYKSRGRNYEVSIIKLMKHCHLARRVLVYCILDNKKNSCQDASNVFTNIPKQYQWYNWFFRLSL